jgi:hypothetical protein
MVRTLSPIHSPLHPDDVMDKPVPYAVSSAASSRIEILAALDQCVLSGRKHSLGPGGASAAFARAVDKALIDEMAEQLREGPFEAQEGDSEVRRWAVAIVEAFREE